MSELWAKFERELAGAILGELTPGSGNQRIKGDGQSASFIAEAKWRDAKSGDRQYIDLLESWLTTLAGHAEKRQKIPVLGLSIASRVTLCLIPYPIWSEHAAKLCEEGAKRVSLGERKQVRLYSDIDYYYTVFEFARAGEWIVLPRTDLRFLAAREQEDVEGKTCKKLRTGSKWPKRTGSTMPDRKTAFPKRKLETRSSFRRRD